MAKFYVDNIVRILRKRAGADLPDEIGIVIAEVPPPWENCSGEEQEEKNSPPEVYRVLALENCPAGCPQEDVYRGDELELVSWGISLDIYQFGG